MRIDSASSELHLHGASQLPLKIRPYTTFSDIYLTFIAKPEYQSKNEFRVVIWIDSTEISVSVDIDIAMMNLFPSANYIDLGKINDFVDQPIA